MSNTPEAGIILSNNIDSLHSDNIHALDVLSEGTQQQVVQALSLKFCIYPKTSRCNSGVGEINTMKQSTHADMIIVLLTL